jgi:hypothetical protein
MIVPGTLSVRVSHIPATDTAGRKIRAVATGQNGSRRQMTMAYPYESTDPARSAVLRLMYRLGLGPESKITETGENTYVIVL